MYRVLKPGGYIELIEASVLIVINRIFQLRPTHSFLFIQPEGENIINNGPLLKGLITTGKAHMKGSLVIIYVYINLI